MEVQKKEVEELLHYSISDGLFEKSLRYAKKKQEYIYAQEPRKVVKQHWYLVKLTEEYARSLAFSELTVDLCRKLTNMEKEHSVKDQSAHTDNHIVTLSTV